MAKSKFEGKEIRPNDTVEVAWSGDKWHTKGQKDFLHPVQAEKLQAKGKLKITGEVVAGGNPVQEGFAKKPAKKEEI